MFAPRVFVSMIGALIVFAVATFWLTGSAFTTAWQTLLCAVLLQAGYFIGVLILVSRGRAGKAPVGRRPSRRIRAVDRPTRNRPSPSSTNPAIFNS